jgi:menaquinone-dependent protoporphyrinogen oxidase
MTHVMVAYATRHGATRGIAERIGETLRAEGLQATVVDIAQSPDPRSADALVIGSAAYMGKWLDDAVAFVRQHRAFAATRPTWLFSSGPVGTELVDKQGNDVLAPPPFLSRAAEDVHARGTRVFFGRWDPDDPPMSVAERLFRMVPVSKEVLPIGDFRDWPAIEAWAREIARELQPEPVREPVGAR